MTPDVQTHEPSTTVTVPLLDLTAQYNELRSELVSVVTDVLDSQKLINGPAVRQFEEEAAAYCGCSHAIAVSSGTDALLCALMALDIAPGDEVITTPFTFFATAGSIWRTGARPVFVDIDPVTFNIDPNRIAEKITPRTKAIMPVHLFGQLADMDPIMETADAHGLAVIEDAAQSIGATYKGKPACSIGTCGCLSFFPSKNLGGLGDGGMVLTQDPEFAERCAIMRNHGAKPKYFHHTVGANFRMDTIQAAYLSVKLRHLDEWSEGRRRNAARYNELLADIDQVTTPEIAEHNVSIYNQYVIRAADRDGLNAFLGENNVGTAIYYPLSLHEQACFADLGYASGDFPQAERAAQEVLALPIYPELSNEQLEHVAETIRRYYR